MREQQEQAANAVHSRGDPLWSPSFPQEQLQQLRRKEQLD
jgi:hypothetical protein